MTSALRVTNVVLGVLCAALAAGFLSRAPWATRLWPFAALETRLGFIFLGSIAAAIAAPTIWIGLSGEARAAEGGSINLMVTFWGMAVFLAERGVGAGRPDLVHAAVVCALLGAAVAWGFVTARRIPWRDERPMPAFVRWSFLSFSVVLVLVAVALIARAPHVFPWPLARDSSVMYGWVFLGAAAYFAYGVFRPKWTNATGQLLGFLAYDLVLVAPFLKHFAIVNPAHRPSLVVYTAVLIYSAVLAAYYLFVHTSTRLAPAADS